MTVLILANNRSPEITIDQFAVFISVREKRTIHRRDLLMLYTSTTKPIHGDFAIMTFDCDFCIETMGGYGCLWVAMGEYGKTIVLFHTSPGINT